MKRLDITAVSVPPVSGAPPGNPPPSKAGIEGDAPQAPNGLGEEDQDLLNRLEKMAEEVEDEDDNPKDILKFK